jgi:hypothetical protein
MSELLTEPVSGAARTDGSPKFHAELANGLHAMAQPLTVVRGAIEALRMPPAASRNPTRYLDLASEQIERACDLFGCVQDLMASRLVEARRERFDWQEVVTSVVAHHTARLQPHGIGLTVTQGAPWRPANGDPQRAERAVSAALGAAAALASRGDTIHLMLDSSMDVNELRIFNPRTPIQGVNSSTRLYLSLAEENIFSQNGAYQFTENPFSVSLVLSVDRSVPISMAGSRPPLPSAAAAMRILG